MLRFTGAIRNTIECAFRDLSIVANRSFDACVLIWAVLQSERRRRQNLPEGKRWEKN